MENERGSKGDAQDPEADVRTEAEEFFRQIGLATEEDRERVLFRDLFSSEQEALRWRTEFVGTSSLPEDEEVVDAGLEGHSRRAQ